MPSLPALRLNLPSKKVLLLGGSLFLGGYIAWWLLLWISFGEDSVRQQTLSALEKALGREVNYAEETSFSLLPIPKLVMNNIHAKNHPRSREPSMIRIPQVVVKVNPLSIVSGQTIVSLWMQSPNLEVEHFSDGTASWESLPEEKEKDYGQTAAIARIEIENGQIHYRDQQFNREILLREVNGNIQLRSESEMNTAGTFLLNNTRYEFHSDLSQASDTALNLETMVTDGMSSLNVTGSWNKANQSFEGKQSLDTADLGNLLQNLFLPPSSEAEQPAANQVESTQSPVLPLKWESGLKYQTGLLTLENIALNGDYIQGKGKLNAQLSNSPVFTARFDLEKLSLQPMLDSGLLRKLISQSNTTEIVKGFSVDMPEGAQTMLPKGITVDLTLTSKEASLLSMPATELQMVAKMHEGIVDLPQFSGKLPGDTQFILKGAVEGSYGALALKGQLDVAGKKFPEFYCLALSEDLKIPERLESFRGRTNVYLTPSLARFSEGILRIADMQVLGTVVKEQKPIKKSSPTTPALGGSRAEEKPEATYTGVLRIDNLNLDELHEMQDDTKSEGLETYPKLLRLAKIWQNESKDMRLDLKLSLLNYILGGQIRPKAAVNLVLDEGGVALNNVSAVYNGTLFAGSVGLAFPPQALPKFEADITADIIHTSELLEHDFSKDENFWRDPSGAWSRKEFQLEWLHKVNGNVKLLIGALTHDVYDITNININAALKDSVIQLDRLQANVWGGEASVRGQISSGKLPSMSGNFALRGIQLEKLRKVTPLVGDLIGAISVGGDITTSGINPMTTVQNAQGTLTVAGRGIILTGFNLANMVRAANTVRTVDDIDKLVKFADQGGTTTIDLLQGNVNLGGAYLRSPGVTISTSEGSGSINGQLNLMDWNLNSAITIYLTSLQKQSPPYIRLVFAGPLHQAVRSLDTQSLESFIAKHAAERILNTQ